MKNRVYLPALRQSPRVMFFSATGLLPEKDHTITHGLLHRSSIIKTIQNVKQSRGAHKSTGMSANQEMWVWTHHHWVVVILKRDENVNRVVALFVVLLLMMFSCSKPTNTLYSPPLYYNNCYKTISQKPLGNNNTIYLSIFYIEIVIVKHFHIS